MTESSLASHLNNQNTFITPLRALLWREWREMRRPFIGSILALVVLPGLFGVAYLIFVRLVNNWGSLHDWEEFKNVIAASIIGLAGLGSFPLAAGWGAYAVCRDLNSPSAAFLFSRSVASRRVLLSKAVVAWLLYTLFLCVILAVALFLFDSKDAGFLAKPEFCSLYYSGLIAGLFTSFASAVFTKRLVPSTLLGLLGALLYIIVPSIWSEFAYEEAEKVCFLYKSSLVSFGIASVLFSICYLMGWRVDRPQLSNRTIVWVTIFVLLVITAVVSDSFATDTEQVASMAANATLIGSDDSFVYWFENTWVKDGVWTPTIVRASFDNRGKIVDRRSNQLIGMPVFEPRTVPNYQLRDFKNLIVVQGKQDAEIASKILLFQLDFEKTEAVAKSVDVFGYASSREWCFHSGYLYHLDVEMDSPPPFVSDHHVNYHESPTVRSRMFCVDPSEGTARIRSQTESVPLNWGRTDIVDGELRLTVVWNESDKSLLRQFAVDTSDPGNVAFSKASQPLVLRGQPKIDWSRAMEFVAIQGNKLAYATDRGVGLVELSSRGEWIELDWRSFGVLERFAGCGESTLSWRGSRLFSSSQFGLLIFDTSDPRNLRRIGHSSEYLWAVVGLGDSHFLEVRGWLTVFRLRS